MVCPLPQISPCLSPSFHLSFFFSLPFSVLCISLSISLSFFSSTHTLSLFFLTLPAAQASKGPYGLERLLGQATVFGIAPAAECPWTPPARSLALPALATRQMTFFVCVILGSYALDWLTVSRGQQRRLTDTVAVLSHWSS